MRRRRLKVTIPLAFVVTILVNRLGWLDEYVAGGVLVALEIALIAWVALRIVLALRTVPLRATNRQPLWTTIRDVVLDIMPKPVAMLFLGELAMWTSFIGIFRHGFRLRPGEFSYHRHSSILAWALLIVVTAPAEILLIEVLLPWRTVRLLLLFLACYSVVWFLGYVVAHFVYPHAVNADAVHLRTGALARITLAPQDIASASIDTSKLPFEKDGWGVTVLDDTAYLAIEGKADVRIELSEPRAVWSPSGDTGPVSVLRVAADEPAALIDAIRIAGSAKPGSSFMAS